MTDYANTTYEFDSVNNPQVVLPLDQSRVAIHLFNNTANILYFSPLDVFKSGGQLFILQPGEGLTVKWRDYGDITMQEWWADLVPGGAFTVTEVIVF